MAAANLQFGRKLVTQTTLGGPAEDPERRGVSGEDVFVAAGGDRPDEVREEFGFA